MTKQKDKQFPYLYVVLEEPNYPAVEYPYAATGTWEGEYDVMKNADGLYCTYRFRSGDLDDKAESELKSRINLYLEILKMGYTRKEIELENEGKVLQVETLTDAAREALQAIEQYCADTRGAFNRVE